jgi:hypothetical protein
MPCVGFKPTIPVFEWAKTFHALDGVATMIGIMTSTNGILWEDSILDRYSGVMWTGLIWLRTQTSGVFL